MPWIATSGNSYDLCLLDTNALSEILKNKKNEMNGFLKLCPPNKVAPCFTFYNLIELRRRDDLFASFIKFFSQYPIFLLKPREMMVEEEFSKYESKEKVSPLLNSFTSVGHDSSYDLKKFIETTFKDTLISTLEHGWREMERDILESWLASKPNFIPKNTAPNSQDAERYIEEAGLQTLIGLNFKWCEKRITKGIVPEIDFFPSIKVSLYSLYYRLYNTSWNPSEGEVTDILISSITPYMDMFITEKFQANIMTKIKKKVLGLDSLKIYKMKDLRK